MTARQDVVLIVDDDLAVRESLKFALQLEGLTVRTCNDGEELLNHPELRQASCILLDYKMPAMSGLDVADSLVALGVRVPVIMITGQASGSIVRRATAAGVRHILEKPLLDGMLLDRIQDVIAAPAHSSGSQAT